MALLGPRPLWVAAAWVKAGRPVPGRTAYKERVKRFLRSRKAQDVAMKYAWGLRKVAKRVVKHKGAAVRG